MSAMTVSALLESGTPSLTKIYLDQISKAAQPFATIEQIGAPLPIELGDQGQFPWYWATPENYCAERTYNWVDRIVQRGDGSSIRLAGAAFSNEYLNLIKDVFWKIGSRDVEKMNKARVKSEKDIQAIVSQYEGIFGTITSEEMAKAAVKTKIDYIVQYQVSQVWASQPPLELTEDNIWSLAERLGKVPASARTLVPAIQLYLSSSGALDLERDTNNKRSQLMKLISNTERPSPENGGMTVADAQKNLSARVQYQLPEIGRIEGSLNNANQSASVMLKASAESTETVNVSVSGEAGISIPVAELFSLDAEGQVHYNAFQMNTSSSNFEINMTFHGLTVYPIPALEYRAGAGTGKGWFDPTLLQEAVTNGESDVSGYEFTHPPQRDLTKEGNFGRLTNLVISELPTVEISFATGSASQSIQHFDEHASVTFSIFGIPLGSSEESYSWTKIENHSSGEGFTIKLEPPKVTGSTTASGQLAYVLGATAEYPAATS
jgi:hypothetical protein